MTALEHEITATQIILFQRTGKLLEIAEEVKRERETLIRLLQQANESRQAQEGATR